MKYCFLSFLVMLLLSGCIVGPNYVRPPVEVPAKFKEATGPWKIADPQDAYDRGAWWEVFHDPELNTLEKEVDISNQNIAAAEAQYLQSRALVAQAIAAYFPTVNFVTSFTRQKLPSSGLTGASSTTTSASGTTTVAGTGSSRTGKPFNTYLLALNATWAPDLWGSVHRMVEANKANAQATAAQLAGIRLSSQATLAQDYFELRTLDSDQRLLDAIVVGDRKTLDLVLHSYRMGVTSGADIAQAQLTLKTEQAIAVDNGILRAQFEHAIAVLIGHPPATFSLPQQPINREPPPIPLELPSTLLERRPDIAQFERQVAQANAQVGVAIAAFYPVLSLTGTSGFQSNSLNKLFSFPSFFWSIGSQLTQYVIDGGLRLATAAAARYAYQSTVALYRQTVLAAFQNVEDNLASLRILAQEEEQNAQALEAAKTAEELEISDFHAGTVPYSSVITAQINAYTAEKNAVDTNGRRMIAAVGLIEALGGGWDAASLKGAGEAYVCTRLHHCTSIY
jgi:NodT family efflux transporter outer membrane factor (OMF) lipoprotein